jgi:hypothetical protein
MTEKTVRLTIPVSQQTHDVFSRISRGSGVPLGKCMGSWLADTLDAADYMAQKFDELKQRPAILSRELTNFAAGLSVSAESVIERAKGSKMTLTPPSSNTGGKVSKTRKASPVEGLVFPLPPAKVQGYADTNGIPPKGKK